MERIRDLVMIVRYINIHLNNRLIIIIIVASAPETLVTARFAP